MSANVLVEEVPWGCAPHITTHPGSVVAYVGRDCRIRYRQVGKYDQFLPGFWTAPVQPEMEAILLDTLRHDLPEADAIHHLKSSYGFFMCAVRHPIEKGPTVVV